MPKKAKVAKFSASVQAGGASVSVESLRIEMDINTFPVAKVNGPAGADGEVKEPITSESLSRIQGLQQKRLSGVISPDVSISATDGIGGSMSFTGFLSAPILETSSTNTAEQFSAIGIDALVDAIDMSIYRAGYFSTRKQKGQGVKLKPIPEAKEGDVGKTIRGVTRSLLGNYENSLALETTPISIALLQMRHEINMGGPIGLWLSILGGSKVTFESWAAAFEKNGRIATRLSERVYEVMASRTPGFWNVVRSFMSEFQMFYVPSFSGTGKFVRADEKVSEEASGGMNVSAEGVSLADGSQRLLQVGGVLMIGSSAPTVRSQTGGMQPRAMAYWPSPLISGHIHEITPPWWLLDPEGMPIFDAEFTKPTEEELKKEEEEGAEPLDLDLAKRNKRIRTGADWRDEVEEVSTGVMTEICKVMFADLQLAGSTAVLTLPLNFRMNNRVGKRVTVSIRVKNGDSPTFTAFVSGITHSIDLRNGRSLNSSTQVRLTHARY